jgi:hypothetical protein
MFDEYEKSGEEAIMLLWGDFLELVWRVWGLWLVLRLSRDEALRAVIANRPSADRCWSENSS